MSITPLDIQQKTFKNRLFGYEPAAVDQFLEQLADEMERQNRQIHELQEDLARAQKLLSDHKARERVINETMLTAQKVSGELREGAQREAELILAEARLEGDRLLREAEQRRLRISEDIQEIHRQKIAFQAGMRALVESHLKLLAMDVLTLPGKTLEDAMARALRTEERDLEDEEADGPAA